MVFVQNGLGGEARQGNAESLDEQLADYADKARSTSNENAAVRMPSMAAAKPALALAGSAAKV
jgi:hypothetical protein